MLVVLVALGTSCKTAKPSAKDTPSKAPSASSSFRAAVPQAVIAPRAHAKIAIPAGKVVAGSTPGDDGRDPTLEPALASYTLKGFSIDELPYPNDPALPAKTGASKPEAEKLCAAKGGRLCSELEWERACRGPENDTYGSGANWNPTCVAESALCVSGFGVRAMGASSLEWTASTIELPKISPKKPGGVRSVARGAMASSMASAHRCAVRHPMDAHAKSAAMAFRCCYGESNTVQMTGIEALAAFRTVKVDVAGGPRLAEILSAPELSRVRAGARSFAESDLAHVMKDKTAKSDSVVTTDAIWWSPEHGVELLVVAGKSRGGSFVVAAHKLGDGKFRVASSLVFPNEQGPIALSYQSDLRREIAWSMAYGVVGETGAVTWRDDHRAVIVQR